MTESGSAAIAENDVEEHPMGAPLVIDPSGGRCLAPRSPRHRYFTVPRPTILDVPTDEWQLANGVDQAPSVPHHLADPALAEADGSGIPLIADPGAGSTTAPADPWADAAAPVSPTVPGVPPVQPTPLSGNGAHNGAVADAAYVAVPAPAPDEPQLRRLDVPAADQLHMPTAPVESVVPVEHVALAPTAPAPAAPAALVEPALEPSEYGDDIRVDAERSARTAERAEDSADRTRTIIEWVAVLAGALIVALVIKTFLFQAFFIPSESMENTLLENDRVLVNKLSYRLQDVQIGNIVVFARPDGLPSADDSDLIKRVMALPGDRIRAVDGVLHINDRPAEESYLKPGSVLADFPTDDGRTWNGGDILVGPNEVFVMGDNRDNSSDSRVFGPVSQDLIIGRAFVRVFPLNRLGGL